MEWLFPITVWLVVRGPGLVFGAILPRPSPAPVQPPPLMTIGRLRRNGSREDASDRHTKLVGYSYKARAPE